MRQGFGVAQLSTWLVADLLAQGELMRVLPSQAVDGLPLYLLWQRSRQLLPKVDAVLAMGVWGIANTALYPVCQIRVMKAAPQAHALAGTLNVSAANGGIALGALLGGASIDAWG